MNVLDARPTNELVASYRSAIAEKHQAGKRADEKLREAILSKFETTRQCGMLIADARGDLKDREFTEATDFLDDAAVQAYLKFARLNPEPETDLERAIHLIRLALQPSGALQFPNGHGAQVLHQPNFFSDAIGLIQKLLGIYRHYLRRSPLRRWRSDQLQSLVASLRPLADAYRGLTQEAESRCSTSGAFMSSTGRRSTNWNRLRLPRRTFARLRRSTRQLSMRSFAGSSQDSLTEITARSRPLIGAALMRSGYRSAKGLR